MATDSNAKQRMAFLGEYMKLFNGHLQGFYKTDFIEQPSTLYEPCKYILNLPAKRIRPVLTILAYELFETELSAPLLKAATGLEIFHNSTLMHDDIMDEAPLRRGSETVHVKWNINTAILSGDAMIIKSFQAFEDLEPAVMKECMTLFSSTCIEVCRGQQWDLDFETRDFVTSEEYIEMIKLKTSVLVAYALKLGAIIAGAPEPDAQALYDFGLNMGIAFQIQDDYLDLWGDQAKVGKRIGGDIYDNKKTILYIKALDRANASQKAELLKQFSTRDDESSEKLKVVKQIFEDLKIGDFVKDLTMEYKSKAMESLKKVNCKQSKDRISLIADYLIKRVR